ncbi:Brca1-associated ring domain protein 1, partial [Plakobranchus ocellatus]
MECVKLLVERGANVMARNTHGLTPIDIAKTEDVREALLLSEKSAVAPEEDSFMEEDICKGVRLCFVSSSLTKEEMLSAQKCSKLLDAKMVEIHSTEVTHSIHGVNAEGLCQRTLKYLKAILCGTWIINTD